MGTLSKESSNVTSSEFLNLKGVEYYLFEEDFMENNMRCIPMIVRFKMDKAGIKLKLSEWNKFTTEEKVNLAKMSCLYDVEVFQYNRYLTALVKKNTGKKATPMPIDHEPLWSVLYSIPGMLNEKLNEFGWIISLQDWQSLTSLQRFALLKLCRPGHENRNFPKAMREFKLVN